MLKYILPITLVVFNLQLSAQIENFVKMKWGSVPKEDLRMSVYKLDTTAQAVVLGDEGKMIVSNGFNDFEYSLLRHKRIKILDEAAIDEYGQVHLYYNHKSDLEYIGQIKAQTVMASGRPKSISNKEIRREVINDQLTKVTFKFTNVTVGSVIEYRYQLHSRQAIIPNEWTFREDIPVRSSYFNFENNSSISYTFIEESNN